MRLFAFLAAILLAVGAAATPVCLDWQPVETLPAKVARPFHGFLPNGNFLVAGGSAFVDGKKVYAKDVFQRDRKGVWTKVGELPAAVAEGVTCETINGILCAGGTDGTTVSTRAFLLGEDGKHVDLPDLPEPVQMGGAACDGRVPYVVSATTVYRLDGGVLNPWTAVWRAVAKLPGPPRGQPVVALQNGDQKEKVLVVAGGYDLETKAPLRDVYGLVVSQAPPVWKRLADLPEKTTTIGAAFLPSGHQHLLLVGGFGWDGWVARAQEGSTESDPVKLGWQRSVYAYNCVTDAWCVYGELPADMQPRCGAAAGLRRGKTPAACELLLAGGEVAPRLRTDVVARATFRKVGKFGWTAWLVVGVYALGMVAMACFFALKKKDANAYFRGGGKIPWYVAGMSIFATMLSSITFIAIPTQAYLQDVRYFVMAFFILAIAPVAIRYYLPFFCRLNLTSAYEYLEQRFNLGVRLFGSAAFIVFMVCRVAVVTLLPSIALNAVTGVSIDACILICGVLTMAYCSLGGLEAVIWSDFIQGLVLMGGAVSVLVLLIAHTGPAGAHVSTFWSTASAYGKNTLWDFRPLLTEPVFWVVAVQGLVSNLSSYTSDQCVIQRYIATPDEQATRRSIWFNGVMSVFAQVVFYGIGIALFAFYHHNPAAMDVTMPKGDSILPTFMATEMPPWLAGLVIAAVFAATISTLSANLSSASTAVVTDFIKRFNPRLSGAVQIRCGQAATLVIGLVGVSAALVLARLESPALFDNFNKYIAMLTAGLTGLFFMGVFLPRVKGGAAVCGLVANYIVCFGCESLQCNVLGVRFHPFLLGGLGLVACLAVSLLASCIPSHRETGGCAP